jgi:hypothetical protein
MEEASLMDEVPSEYPDGMTPDPGRMVGTPDVNERPESSTSNQAADNGKQEILYLTLQLPRPIEHCVYSQLNCGLQ